MSSSSEFFHFLTLAEEARERVLERGLLEHLRDFMLELGVGFALSAASILSWSMGRTISSTCSSTI